MIWSVIRTSACESAPFISDHTQTPPLPPSPVSKQVACTLHSISIAVSENAHPRMHFWSIRKPPAIVQSSKSSKGMYVVSFKGYVSFSARKYQQRVCGIHYPLDDSASMKRMKGDVEESERSLKRPVAKLKLFSFPDFPTPFHIKEADVAAITADFNQYRHMQGVYKKVASAFEMAHGVKVDPATEVTVCCGQSEALAAAILADISEYPRDFERLGRHFEFQHEDIEPPDGPKRSKFRLP
ncbi:hypothetical protein O6H91_Y398400 [Diphasiastrum complanatum]|nr:hypothetical protein O6H91_Y398400 [Diphasiastrum complanatum]